MEVTLKAVPDFNALREDYKNGTLDEASADPNPLRQFERWFAEAVNSGLREPNAMTLATATEAGEPDARIVLLKGVDARGLTFFTNYGSQKGRELAENPRAALVFFWAELERQIRIRGGVEKVSREETEAYFATRPVKSRLGAAVSAQSSVIPGRAWLEGELAQLEARYPDSAPPCPESWGGYRLAPSDYEFWQGRRSRLHDRLRYRRDGVEGNWIVERLSP